MGCAVPTTAGEVDMGRRCDEQRQRASGRCREPDRWNCGRYHHLKSSHQSAPGRCFTAYGCAWLCGSSDQISMTTHPSIEVSAGLFSPACLQLCNMFCLFSIVGVLGCMMCEDR